MAQNCAGCLESRIEAWFRFCPTCGRSIEEDPFGEVDKTEQGLGVDLPVPRTTEPPAEDDRLVRIRARIAEELVSGGIREHLDPAALTGFGQKLDDDIGSGKLNLTRTHRELTGKMPGPVLEKLLTRLDSIAREEALEITGSVPKARGASSGRVITENKRAQPTATISKVPPISAALSSSLSENGAPVEALMTFFESQGQQLVGYDTVDIGPLVSFVADDKIHRQAYHAAFTSFLRKAKVLGYLGDERALAILADDRTAKGTAKAAATRTQFDPASAAIRGAPATKVRPLLIVAAVAAVLVGVVIAFALGPEKKVDLAAMQQIIPLKTAKRVEGAIRGSLDTESFRRLTPEERREALNAFGSYLTNKFGKVGRVAIVDDSNRVVVFDVRGEKLEGTPELFDQKAAGETTVAPAQPTTATSTAAPKTP